MRLSSDNDSNKNVKYFLALGLTLSLLVGSFVRFIHVLPIDYPLNDGGFFYTLIQDLQETKTILPTYSSYNNSNIPFGYPPLGFFIAAFLSRSLSTPILDLIRLLPPILSCLTIPAFFLLARKLLPSAFQVVSATFAFALLPTAFDWLIVGAGLTRATGFLFAILTLIQIHSLFTTSQNRNIFLATLYASLTILSHPGVAWFTFYSSGVLFFFFVFSSLKRTKPPQLPNSGGSRVPSKVGRSEGQPRKLFFKSTLVVLGTAILTSPWWGTLLHRHGLQTLLYPYQTESFSLTSLITPFSLLFTNEPLIDILAVIGFFGFLICLRERKYLLPGWLTAVFIFEPRLSAVYAAIPMALLVGIGFDQGILPLVTPHDSTSKSVGTLTKFTIGFLLIYALISAYLAPQYNSLSQAQFDSMDWINQHTPENSQFIVITGNKGYGGDYTNEWFPALSHRNSLATPQGHEWLPDKEFSRRISLHAELQTYASADIASLEAWTNSNQLPFSHIYIAKKALQENNIQFGIIQDSLENSPSYEFVFENEDSMIFAKKP